MTEPLHADLSASGSTKWIKCAASVQAERGIPNEDNVHSLYGSAAHALAECCLSEELPARHFLHMHLIKPSKKDAFYIDVASVEDAYSEFVIEDEMIVGVQMYLDYCNNLEGEDFWIEKKVFFGDWVPDQWGTADYIKIKTLKSADPKKFVDLRVVNVVDLKFGKGIKVFAEKNSQAMLYALGVYNDYYFMYEFIDDDIFNIVIVQPRLDHIDEYQITVGELLTWAEDVAAPAAKKTKAKNPAFTPGTHCDKSFCRARSGCKALAEYNSKAVFDDFDTIEDIQTGKATVKDLTMLDNREVGVILAQRKTIENFLKQLANHAYTEAMDGRAIFDHKIVMGQEGNRKFDDPKETEEWIWNNKLLKKKGDMFNHSLKSPPQIEKAIKANGKKFDGLEEYYSRSAGAKTIVHISDKRQAINVDSVADDFNDITEGT